MPQTIIKPLIIAMFFAITSCTLDKTDYEDEMNSIVTEDYDFKEAISFSNSHYKISLETLNGTFYKGYNEIRLMITNTQTNENIVPSDVTFLPVMTNANNENMSCPHRYNLVYNSNKNYYSGYVVFTTTSEANNSWKLYLNFSDGSQTFSVNQTIAVEEQTNKNLNMTAFTGNNGEQYFIALVAPQKPKVAENELVAGIYTYNTPTNPAGTFPDPTQFSYSEVSSFTLQLDPRMPEPSMGNHSSPNNQDLTQQNDGLYHGVVNYTMTGNWTLNFILLNQNNEIIKGTEVPTDFTPGVDGVKSELFIDILF